MRLADWRIAAKVLLSPGIAVVLLGVLALVGGLGLARQDQRLQMLSGDVFEEAEHVAAFKEAVTAYHTNLYRLSSFAANVSDVSSLQQRLDSAVADSKNLENTLGLVRGVAYDPQVLGGFGIAGGGQTMADVRGDLQKGLRAYREATDQVLTMLSVDVATSIMFMVNAEHEFDALAVKMNLLGDHTAQVVEAASAAASADIRRSTLLFVAIAVVAGVGAIVVSLIISRLISGPVVALTRSMELVAAGTLEVDLSAADRRDEIGAMGRALRVFRDRAAEQQVLERRQAEAARAKEAQVAAIERLVGEFDAKVGRALSEVSQAGTEMRSAADEMVLVAEETTQQSNAVVLAADNTATNVQTVASATEELSCSIRAIGESVQQSTLIAQRAVAGAERTGQSVEALSNAARRIGEVVDLIESIANQTNLLALNATIEAARAGEAGKGFAVVAGEVKNLAAQTSRATGDIAAQVAAIQEASTQTVGAIDEITGVIREVNDITASITVAVDQQMSATQEIARNVQNAASGTQEVSSNISGVSQAASRTGGMASTVLSAVGRLSKQADMLRDEVSGFLVAIRAA